MSAGTRRRLRERLPARVFRVRRRPCACCSYSGLRDQLNKVSLGSPRPCFAAHISRGDPPWYLSHFKLKKKPFDISPDPDFLWLGEKHQEGLALARIGRWLAPVARAKIVRVPAAVVSPDGATLFATGRTGLLAVATVDLRLRDRYLPDLELNSLALDAGEGRLYTVVGTPPDPASLLVVDQMAQVLREIEGVGQPRAVLRVGQPCSTPRPPGRQQCN